ncbi:peptide chain release factor 1-like, mitochondrial isoform X1 [Chelonoidis abingdonii]|uniref:Peptide chain release factor 1-like, mitochondrial n=1 Tax=Chelonoidis abingdonii TaxID=106734 RepID=A0A8C0GI22_CHEAB|nr:peptide chain release factor 1-like, mitochondrial isoform X1 [Chelonoidis abingdonii]
MRLLARTVRAAQGLRAAPPPARSCRGAALCGGRAAHQPRRPLSSWPGLETLFATPALRRFLEEQAGVRAGPELRARIQRLWAKEQELRDTQELARADENEDLQKLAEEEIVSCREEITELKRQIVLHLIPSEETDNSDLVMEVTAGVGGQEAMLFTAEIFDMYQQYAAYKNWRFEILEYFPSEIGGLRHAAASIAGLEAYKHMKFEGGVHRVQRVPKTEKQGRIHTSTMTIALLPQPMEINLIINPKDLQIETKRASGAGGQHVNTTDSAVRIVHIPTGVVSECQQERSQIRNKEKAMQMLRAKLYSIKLEEETRKRYNARKIQIGTKGRSEKIRTYNFPQDRVTDHRINRTVHHIESFMLGEELLDEMITSLREYADYETLMEIISENVKTNLT